MANKPTYQQLEKRVKELEKALHGGSSAGQGPLQGGQDCVDLFQALGHPTLILNPDYTVVAANPAALAATGRPAEAVVGRKCYEVFHGTDSPPESCPLGKMLVSKSLETDAMEIEALGGAYLVACTPVRDEEGRVEKVIHMATDITDRKRAEEALRASQAFLDSIIDQSPHPMCISDEEGTLVRLNQTCCDLLNLKKEEVVGKYNVLKDNMIEEQGHMPLVASVFREGKAARFTMEYDSSKLKQIELQRSAQVILDTTVFPIKDAQGRVTNTVIQHKDVTKQKEAERACRESEERFRAIFEQAAIGVAQILTKTGQFLRVNQRYCDIVGRKPEEMTATTFMAITHPDDLQAHLDNMEELKRGKSRNFSMEKRCIRKDGSVVWLNLTVSPMWEVGDEPNYHVAVVEDITERKNVEEALRKYESIVATSRDLMSLNPPAKK
ncbi:MAG: PAS domain S-box protein [Thermodesulfobacteriota bacterium]|nr:PAS domain S-box protein [Thermodesulfobacteriota bacterium]